MKYNHIFNSFKKFLIYGYLISALLLIPYFNYQFAKRKWIYSWLIFGEIIATGKAVIWPYYAVKSLIISKENNTKNDITKTTINIDLINIKLCSEYSDIKKTFILKDKQDPVVNLYNKFGIGDANERIIINQSFNKIYSVNNIPPEIKAVNLYFQNNILYQVAIYYPKEYCRNNPWEAFIKYYENKYGKPEIQNAIESLSSYTYTWTDGKTILEISAVGNISKGKNILILLGTIYFIQIFNYLKN